MYSNFVIYCLKCVMLCSVNMILYKFHFLLCISIHLCKCFTIIAVLLCTLQSIRKRLFLGRKTVYTGPLPQLYGSFLHIFQLRSFQIIILQTFLIAIIIDNNIGKYLLTRQNIKKRKKLQIFGQGALFQNWSYSKSDQYP